MARSLIRRQPVADLAKLSHMASASASETKLSPPVRVVRPASVETNLTSKWVGARLAGRQGQARHPPALQVGIVFAPVHLARAVLVLALTRRVGGASPLVGS